MRIQFELTEEKANELTQLMNTISTKKDLFENALTFLEWAVNELQQDPDRIIGSIKEKEDTYKELQMAAFSNARSKAKALLQVHKEVPSKGV
ncbi:MAG: hypothetical protein ACREXM_09140 [Gammaproteobacteria bacterium]